MQAEITILIYFIFIVGIGVYSAFRIKTTDDYFVAGKKAGLIPVSGSLLATILGGSAILGTIELSQKLGWPGLWFLFSAALGLFVLIPISKYVRRYGNYTLPELLGTFYGKKAETISSVIIPIAWIGIVAAQIIAAAKILNGLGFISYQNAAIVSGLVFIIYTLLGGQHSILKTDTLQAVLIIGGLVFLFVFASMNPMEHTFETFQFSLLFNTKFSLIDLLILILTYSVTFVVGPDIYSRVFCAKNEKTASRSILLVALILIPTSFVLTYLGIYANETGAGIVAFAEHLLPGWAYGLFIAALLSAVMSSADTTLLTSSIIVSELITGNLNKSNSLKLTRYFILFTGAASLLIALFVTSIIQALLLALTFFSGAFVVPTLAGLLKIKVNKKRVANAILIGGTTALAGKIIQTAGSELVGNTIIISSYILNAAILWNYKKPNTNSDKL
ncbi:sodium:solute symporter family protein [uncultured Draconibacterium sp.]|uniref:sodium:solute symporter family protein n=1 Tax=uncultured Draconibacterium sp. TaxID=1573823 RepID=UPI0032166534